MLENRSFDHMLGYSGIPGVDGVLGKQCSNPFRGRDVPTTPDAASVDDLIDPGHDYADVFIQMYFGDDHLSAHAQPKMLGFVESYSKVESVEKPQNIMHCYRPEDIPVLTTLAREFAVCNRWFSSVPGPTLPNRLFAHAGTSKGRLDISAEEFDTSPTIYEVLDKGNVPSTIYADGWTATATFLSLMKYQDQFFGTLDDFFQDCNDNNLPGYCFLEPRYTSGIVDGIFRPQNDQHPDSDVLDGENLIYSVFQAIRSNRAVWESSVLVIVYDEHGGLYDHVPPPSAPRPDNCCSSDPPFRFDRYGVRVPAVIVSAYTQNVVCNQTYDHTSLIATARKLFTPHWKDDTLGNRAMHANTFESALNLRSPRNDEIKFLAPRPITTRGRPDRGERSAKKKRLNDLQIKHLKQALVVDQTLGLRVRPGSKFKNVSSQDAADQFKSFSQDDAEHYIQSVLAATRSKSRQKRNQLPKKCSNCDL